MRLHPREALVREARIELHQAVLDWLRKEEVSELTAYEEVMVVTSVLSQVITGAMKYAIREERHGDAETPGGLAIADQTGEEAGVSGTDDGSEEEPGSERQKQLDDPDEGITDSVDMEPSAVGPSDPDSPCSYCRAYSVGTPASDGLVCDCETPCAATRCSARETSKDCAGGCGTRIPKNRTACMDCWGLLPSDMREAVTVRRGAMRAAVIAQARKWYAANVSKGRLTDPLAEPNATVTHAEHGASTPVPAPERTEPTDETST
jgi:hypothetical protein